MTINSSCCTYINTSFQVKASVAKIHQHATWLQQILDRHTPLLEGMGTGIIDWFSSLFSWIPNGIKPILGGTQKLGLTIYLLLFFYYIV